MRVVGVIPARFKSSRLEGKALADIHGKPMVEHVWERCVRVRSLHEVIIATDDVRIQRAAEVFGARVAMTDPAHTSGTDRVAEAVEDIDCEVIVNIQGDEPMLDPVMIEEIVEPFAAEPDTQLATIKKEISDESELLDPNVVKVVTDNHGNALYFSRSLIPFRRPHAEDYRAYKHLGLYAYTKDCLRRFSSLPPAPLERIERLEQLRALENGIPIRVVLTKSTAQGVAVDTPEDLEAVRRFMKT